MYHNESYKKDLEDMINLSKTNESWKGLKVDFHFKSKYVFFTGEDIVMFICHKFQLRHENEYVRLHPLTSLIFKQTFVKKQYTDINTVYAYVASKKKLDRFIKQNINRFVSKHDIFSSIHDFQYFCDNFNNLIDNIDNFKNNLVGSIDNFKTLFNKEDGWLPNEFDPTQPQNVDKKNKKENHYKFIERVGDEAKKIANLQFDPDQISVAHGDKCYGYRDEWENKDIDFRIGALLYLMTHMLPYCTHVRETDDGWVDPGKWVIDFYYDEKNKQLIDFLKSSL